MRCRFTHRHQERQTGRSASGEVPITPIEFLWFAAPVVEVADRAGRLTRRSGEGGEQAGEVCGLRDEG